MVHVQGSGTRVLPGLPNPPPRRADLASRRSAAAQHDHSLWPHAAYPGGYAAREPAHGCGLWSDTGRWVRSANRSGSTFSPTLPEAVSGDVST